VDSLITVLGFLVALGVLVTIHEFGHFYVARRCGVKVLRFSIGFGKPLWTWTDKQGTDYTLSPIPLGGFVKMLDERESQVPEALQGQTFNGKGVWQRIAIVAAGPIANFILAIVLFSLMLLPGTRDVAPVIGEVIAGSVAEKAGLEAGQEIVSVDGAATPTWQDFHRQLLNRLGESGTIHFTVRYPESTLEYQSEAPLDEWLKGADEPNPVEGIGVKLYRPAFTPVIAQVLPESPAAAAGIQAGDLIVSADGQDMLGWMNWVSYVRERPEQVLSVVLERRGERLLVNLMPKRTSLESGEVVGQVGLAPKRPEWPKDMLRTREYTVFEALLGGAEKTWETSAFVLLSLKKLVVGQISTKNLSGPITIAKVAGASAKAGITYYLGFMALLSVSLGVFNLLPIPVLDGGHLFYYLIEVVKGSPVAEKVQLVGYQMGLVLVLGVMVLALYNDVMRL